MKIKGRKERFTINDKGVDIIIGCLNNTLDGLVIDTVVVDLKDHSSYRFGVLPYISKLDSGFIEISYGIPTEGFDIVRNDNYSDLVEGSILEQANSLYPDFDITVDSVITNLFGSKTTLLLKLNKK